MRSKEHQLNSIRMRYTDMEEMRKASQSYRRMGYSKKIVAFDRNSVEVEYTRKAV